MIALRSIIFLATATAWLSAEPLPEGSYVDLIVVPVGPVALAEFEESNPAPAPAKPGEKKAEDSAPQGGSGVRVKQQDPLTIPPRAVYLKRGKDKYSRIPCFFNAVTTPVRVPVRDTEITFLLDGTTAKNSFVTLDKCQLQAAGQCVLVLLTKPLSEKRWTHPQVTLIPVAEGEAAQLLIANASQSLSCGAAINGSEKILLAPLRHYLWRPEPKQADNPASLALAMATGNQQFLPPFYQNNLVLPKSTTTLLISYDVTPQESFRCGKYATGSFKPGEFRPATVYPENT